jgi:hypothetical protein
MPSVSQRRLAKMLADDRGGRTPAQVSLAGQQRAVPEPRPSDSNGKRKPPGASHCPGRDVDPPEDILSGTMTCVDLAYVLENLDFSEGSFAKIFLDKHVRDYLIDALLQCRRAH